MIDIFLNMQILSKIAASACRNSFISNVYKLLHTLNLT